MALQRAPRVNNETCARVGGFGGILCPDGRKGGEGSGLDDEREIGAIAARHAD